MTPTPNIKIDVSANRRSRKWSRREQLGRMLWALAWPAFRMVPRPFWGWRRVMLRLFGATVGKDVHIHPTAHIAMPWSLSLGDNNPMRANHSSNRLQFDVQALHHPVDGIPPGLMLARQRLVQALAVQPGGLGNMGDAFVPGHITQSSNECIGVVILIAIGQIFSNRLIRFQQTVAGIEGGQFSHGLYLFCQFFGPLDILVLCGLVTAAQQNNNRLPAYRVIHPITLANVYLQFTHTVPNRGGIAKVAAHNARQPLGNRPEPRACPRGWPSIYQRLQY